ncbi:hypothetical protein CDL15_Pgr019869 [Punica granatum]|uniref:Uncharacterized protein n=1 Tax=Punica granatum TaxID=22663 RepID=A0A218W4F0_PUNGR|nr:hypothetical protein CDL15_Pgr019869 [Punica granatum]
MRLRLNRSSAIAIFQYGGGHFTGPLATTGLIEEEKLDILDMPYYTARKGNCRTKLAEKDPSHWKSLRNLNWREASQK